MDIHFDTIQFEITRKCNDSCLHCCRGEAQNLDLDKEVIDAFFDNNNIVSIGRLLLSGGEPTLGPDAFTYLVNKIIEKRIEVRSFNFSINGKTYDQQFVDALIKLNDYSLSLKAKKYNIAGTFWISENQFHSKPKQEILDQYQHLPFFVPYRFDRLMKMKEADILPVGRALENGLSPHTLNVSEITERGIEHKEINHQGRDCLWLPYLYISSNGNIQNDYGSMYSYDLIDQYSFGNITNQKIEDIVLNKKTNNYRLIKNLKP